MARTKREHMRQRAAREVSNANYLGFEVGVYVHMTLKMGWSCFVWLKETPPAEKPSMTVK